MSIWTLSANWEAPSSAITPLGAGLDGPLVRLHVSHDIDSTAVWIRWSEMPSSSRLSSAGLGCARFLCIRRRLFLISALILRVSGKVMSSEGFGIMLLGLSSGRSDACGVATSSWSGRRRLASGRCGTRGSACWACPNVKMPTSTGFLNRAFG